MIRKHVKVEPDRWYYWRRQARHARLAGHAERRQQHGGRETGVRDRAARHDRRAAQSSVDRDVGAVQRRLGPARHRPHYVVVAQGVRPDAPGEQRQRLDRQARRRCRGRARLSRAGDAAGRGEARRRARRVRRPRPAARRPHLARPEQLGLSHVHVARGAGRRLSRPARRSSAFSSPMDSRPPCTRRRPTSRSRSTA